jgi:hypothetical protein
MSHRMVNSAMWLTTNRIQADSGGTSGENTGDNFAPAWRIKRAKDAASNSCPSPEAQRALAAFVRGNAPCVTQASRSKHSGRNIPNGLADESSTRRATSYVGSRLSNESNTVVVATCSSTGLSWRNNSGDVSSHTSRCITRTASATTTARITLSSGTAATLTGCARPIFRIAPRVHALATSGTK